VIPLYNRARFIARTLDSCLAQTARDIEIVVVDDASEDDSLAIVKGYSDDRIRVLPQTRNRGVGPTRNVGVDAATGEWVLPLDSDDELVPTAIETIKAKIATAPADVDAFFFRCKWDDGSISPSVMPTLGRIDYVTYLEHIEACAGRKRDALWCRKKATFQTVRYPDSYGLEDLYHLEFNKNFAAVACDEILRLYHQDADGRLVERTTQFDKERDRRFLNDRGDVLAEAVARHGAAMAKYAPLLLKEQLSRLLTARILCGQRGAASGALLLSLRYGAWSLSSIGIFALGVVDPSLISALKRLRGGMRRAIRSA
jgi:glycosyltransferase involved in cell wall biosynthesis